MTTTPQDAALSKKALSLAILIELRKHTELMINLCRHQDDEIKRQDRFGGVALPFALRTAEPMPAKPVAAAAEYDPVTGCLVFRKPGESLTAQADKRVPAAGDDSQALILAELRGLRAELADDRAERQALGIKIFQPA